MEDRLQQAAARMEEELRRAVTYIDEEVVPEVRRNGSAALRTAAEQLHRLAERMDDERASAERAAAERRKTEGGGV